MCHVQWQLFHFVESATRMSHSPQSCSVIHFRPYLHSRLHAHPRQHYILPQDFLNNFLSSCRTYQPYPTSFPPGRAYRSVAWLRMLLRSASGLLCLASIVTLVNVPMEFRMPLSREDELAVTQRLFRQVIRPVSEVRPSARPKSSKTFTVRFLYSDLIAMPATVKCRSFSSSGIKS